MYLADLVWNTHDSLISVSSSSLPRLPRQGENKSKDPFLLSPHVEQMDMRDQLIQARVKIDISISNQELLIRGCRTNDLTWMFEVW